MKEEYEKPELVAYEDLADVTMDVAPSGGNGQVAG